MSSRIDIIVQNCGDGIHHFRPREDKHRVREPISKNVIRKLRSELADERESDKEKHSVMGLNPSGTGYIRVRADTLEPLLDVYESTQAGFMDK